MANQDRMVKTWFRKSAQDLQTAKLLLSQNNEVFWGPLVFHAQQCTEKAIKGFLTFNKIRFTKTHDIEILVALVANANSQLSEELLPAKILTKYAVVYRYPEEIELPESELLSQKKCEQITIMTEHLFNKLNDLCSDHNE